MRGSAKSTFKADTKKITEDFKKYAEKNGSLIKMAGMEKMGTTLGIDIYSDV
jgi:hypothetical protein